VVFQHGLSKSPLVLTTTMRTFLVMYLHYVTQCKWILVIVCNTIDYSVNRFHALTKLKHKTNRLLNTK